MTIVHCPRCRDEVTVPAKASPRALVRCPLCLEEYLLSEALAEMPPTLLIVGGEIEEEPALVGGGAAYAEAGGEYQLAGGFSGGMLDSSAPAGAAVAPARTGLKSTARPRRKERSALGEMVKIVMGGVIGLSLGLLAIWWIADRDPLKLGPTIAPYAPFLVPAKFHGKPGGSGTTAQTTATDSTAGGPVAPPASGTSTSTTDGNGRPQANGQRSPSQFKSRKKAAAAPMNGGLGGFETPADPLQTLPDPLAESTPDNPLAPASIDLPAFDSPPTTPEANPTEEPQPVESPLPTPKGKAKGKTSPPGDQPDLTGLLPDGDSPRPATPEEASPSPPAPLPPEERREGTPAVGAADLTAAVVKANDSLAKVEEGINETREVRQQLVTDLFLAVADAGRVISHLNPDDADVSEPLGELKQLQASLAGQPGKVSAIGFLGRTNLPKGKTGEGIAFSGTVTDVKSVGGPFECTIDAGSGVTVMLVSKDNPQDFCQIGDQLLVAGRIVDEPQKNIPGYEGDAERVVLLGDAAVVPKAE